MNKLIKFFLIFSVAVFIFSTGSQAVVVDDLTHDHTVQPGDKIEGKIMLKNESEAIQTVKAYQTDYLFYCDGRNLYGDPGITPRSNSSWITFSPSRVTLPPKETTFVYYTVNVPKNDQLLGTYWSMIMVEPVPETSPESPGFEKGKIKFGVQMLVRYAIQISTTIGDTGLKKIKFLDKKIVREEGKRFLIIDIENVGERLLVPWVSAEIFSRKGESLGKFDSASQQIRVYPGCSIRHHIELKGITPGKYKALVVVDNKDEAVFGAQYDLEISK